MIYSPLNFLEQPQDIELPEVKLLVSTEIIFPQLHLHSHCDLPKYLYTVNSPNYCPIIFLGSKKFRFPPDNKHPQLLTDPFFKLAV